MTTQAELDALWDFSDAAGSEARLRAAGDTAVLRTQVARALGLQGRFAEADALLDTLTEDSSVAARVALERGRLRNSAGEPGAAEHFRDAVAHAASDAFLAVDALHMLAIVEPDGDAVRRARAVLDGVADTRTLRWHVSLANNAGWAALARGDRQTARVEFEAALAAAHQWGTPQQIVWAHEALAELDSAG